MAKINPANLRLTPDSIEIKEVGNTGKGTSQECTFSADLSVAASASFPVSITAIFNVVTSGFYELEGGSTEIRRNLSMPNTTLTVNFKFKLKNLSKFPGNALPVTLSIATFDKKGGESTKTPKRKSFPVKII
jgi:hypothetical protein